MKTICEYNNKELFCNLGLYQKLSIDCTDFLNGSRQEYGDLNGYEINYTVYEIKYSEQFKRLIDFMLDTKNIYMFCPLCNKHMSFELLPVTLSDELKNNVVESYHEDRLDEDFSTFEYYKMSERIKKIASENRMFDKMARCTHNKSHVFKFSYLIQKQGEYPEESLTLTKIGQYPSINDFSTENIKHYQKLLEEYKGEYTKALGLYSAGIGIGSFVYLRRVIEFLLENTFKKAEAKGMITRETYMKDGDRNRRVNEKIELLEEYLPKFMVSNAIVYNILSKGIHELDEETCKEMFPVLRRSIELILDEEIAIRQKEKVTHLAKKELAEIKSELSK